MVDANCTVCDYQIRDQFMLSVPDVLYHEAQGGIQHPMEYVYIPQQKAAEWSDRDAVVVFRDAKGEIRYPGRNDLPTPVGCERIVMKSLRAVEQFEKRHGVRNEAIWYDRGSGRSAENDVPRQVVSEQQRLDSFMRGWRG